MCSRMFFRYEASVAGLSSLTRHPLLEVEVEPLLARLHPLATLGLSDLLPERRSRCSGRQGPCRVLASAIAGVLGELFTYMPRNTEPYEPRHAAQPEKSPQ